jgi:hypothetical protein
MPNEFLVQNGLWGTGKSDFSKRAPPAPALNPMDKLHDVTSELEQIVIRMHKELGSEKDSEIKQLKAKLKNMEHSKNLETATLAKKDSEIEKLKAASVTTSMFGVQKSDYILQLRLELASVRQELKDANALNLEEQEITKEVYEELGKEKRDNNATRKKPPKR